MTFNSPNHTKAESAATNRRRGFTLMEVLVATLFMAIVIPVALSAMNVAGMAGDVSQRKLVAARIANRELNDLRVENLLLNAGQSGVVQENGVSYKWTVKTEFWPGDPSSGMNVTTVSVDYNVGGHLCNFQISTLAPHQ